MPTLDKVKAAKIGILGGLLLILVGVFGDGIDYSDVIAIGFALIFGSALWVGLDFYESVRQMSYDDGYADCARAAREAEAAEQGVIRFDVAAARRSR